MAQLWANDGEWAGAGQVMNKEYTQAAREWKYTGSGMEYGYGIFVMSGFTADDKRWQVPTYTHGGNTLSFSSELWMLPEQDFAVSILSSGYGTDFSESVSTALSTLPEGLPEPVAVPDLPEIDPADFDAHVGRFVDPYNVGEMNITRDGDTLFVSMPTLDDLGFDVGDELLPYAPDVHLLSIDGVWFDLTFVRADPAEPSRWVRNRAFVVTRDDASALVAPELDTTREELEALLNQARIP